MVALVSLIGVSWLNLVVLLGCVVAEGGVSWGLLEGIGDEGGAPWELHEDIGAEGGVWRELLEGVVGGEAWLGIVRRKKLLFGGAGGIILVKELAPSWLLSQLLNKLALPTAGFFR